MKVCAMLASHNRCAQTLRCLDSYYAQEVETALELSAVLVDGGSMDGTVRAVQERFPATEVIAGSARLFWAGAMAIAERAAITRGPDYLLWLNDDVVLDRSSLQRLISTARSRGNTCIVVGALRDPMSGELTYSGVRRPGLRPLQMRLIAPGEKPVEIETFHGNVVLIPSAVRARVGPVDGAFVHSFADYDYGLRARAAGVINLLAPGGTVGTCARDHDERPWLDRSVSVKERLKLLVGLKGLPPRPRARYLRRHGGPLWVLFWLVSYVRAVPSVLRPSLRKGGVQ